MFTGFCDGKTMIFSLNLMAYFIEVNAGTLTGAQSDWYVHKYHKLLCDMFTKILWFSDIVVQERFDPHSGKMGLNALV